MWQLPWLVVNHIPLPLLDFHLESIPWEHNKINLMQSSVQECFHWWKLLIIDWRFRCVCFYCAVALLLFSFGFFLFPFVSCDEQWAPKAIEKKSKLEFIFFLGSDVGPLIRLWGRWWWRWWCLCGYIHFLTAVWRRRMSSGIRRGCGSGFGWRCGRWGRGCCLRRWYCLFRVLKLFHRGNCKLHSSNIHISAVPFGLVLSPLHFHLFPRAFFCFLFSAPFFHRFLRRATKLFVQTVRNRVTIKSIHRQWGRGRKATDANPNKEKKERFQFCWVRDDFMDRERQEEKSVERNE